MRIFITSKNKYLSNDMKIFGTCSIPLIISDIFMLNSCNMLETLLYMLIYHFHSMLAIQFSHMAGKSSVFVYYSYLYDR